MHSQKPLALFLCSLALGGVSHSWLLDFSKTATCNSEGLEGQVGGLTDQSNKCMTIVPGYVAMIVTDWYVRANPCPPSLPLFRGNDHIFNKCRDIHCRILLWDEKGCGELISATEPFFNMTLSEAKAQKKALMDPDTQRTCFKYLGDVSPSYASYICSDTGNSTEGANRNKTSTTPEGDLGDDGGW